MLFYPKRMNWKSTIYECDVILSSTYSFIVQQTASHKRLSFRADSFTYFESKKASLVYNSWYSRMAGANPFCLLSLVEFDIKWSWIEMAGYSVVMDTVETTGFPTEKKRIVNIKQDTAAAAFNKRLQWWCCWICKYRVFSIHKRFLGMGAIK